MRVKKVSAIFTTLLVVGLSAVILSGCRIGGPTNEAKDTTVEEEQEETPVVTLEKYNQLEKGMTYEEATKIMGFAGKPMSDESSDSNNKTYVWDGKQKSFLTVTFLKGKLSTKQQVGL
ncbi:hypothetical protein [Rossellomorea vietnamensis]|uniref:hypothetical protein n=1 Tax=Rossellomorea vietnamensis TaxID=218284 RepID=UPI001E6484E4|nr:hypothetical protein [Rossellomorea vietnamensis]MCC5800787.1 hypothetical protein [Rossellomorea vietnamensis]